MAGVIAEAALIERGHIKPRLIPKPRDLELPKVEAEAESKPQDEPLAPPPEVEKDFTWYFKEETQQSQEGGAGTNFNAMLDRMALYAKESKPCTKCGGILEVAEEIIDKSGMVVDRVVHVEEKAGTGFVQDSRPFRDWKQVEQLCHRTTDKAEVRAWLKKHNEAFEWREKLERRDGQWVTVEYKHPLGYGDTLCQHCSGWGWVFKWLKDHKRGKDNLTVDFTGQQFYGNPASKVGGNESLARYARVGRLRASLRATDAISEAAAERWYSEDGQTLAALWDLTPTGRDMLARKPEGWSDGQFFAHLRLIQEREADKKKRARHDAEERDASPVEHKALRSKENRDAFINANREARKLLHRMYRSIHKVLG